MNTTVAMDAAVPQDFLNCTPLAPIPNEPEENLPARVIYRTPRSFMTFRRVLALGFVIFLLPSAAAGSTEGTLVVTGGGWGHSVGLSQYGAQGMALEGYEYPEILQHYFTGVEVKSVEPMTDLRVGLAQSPVSASFRALLNHFSISRNGIHVQDVLQNNLVVITSPAPGVCRISIPTDPNHLASDGSCQIELTKPESSMIETVSTLDSGASTAVRVINYGFVYVRPAPIRFHVGAQMTLEQYMRGIAEIPNAWHVEAQRAQVVAARSYAHRSAIDRRQSATFWNELCFCDVRATTADQNYSGFGSEQARPKWNQAVTDTPGRVITAVGSNTPLKAFYSSSTFGRTEPSEVGFGGAAVSYLKSVDDHWSVLPAVSNPFATWVDSTSLAEAAQQLGFATLTGATSIATSPGGAISRIRFTGTNSSGAAITLDYDTRELRSSTRLGLRSMQVTSVALVFTGEQVALHDPVGAKWFLRSSNGQVNSFFYGNPGDMGFMGDWNCDGVETPGLYRRSDGFVYLRNSNTQGIADVSYFFGSPGDVPLAGDFDGDGCDTVSIYRPSQARFYIINELGQNGGGLGAAETDFLFGNPGDVPFVGDWNGDDIDTPGLRRPSDGFVYLRDSNTQGTADVAFFYGSPGDIPFGGDWDLDGRDSIGLFRPSNKTIYLRNALSTGIADATYGFGETRYKPAGSWGG